LREINVVGIDRYYERTISAVSFSVLLSM